jgi:hypothetical protein
MIYLTQTGGFKKPPFQHDELSTPLNLARQTKIQMPMLDEETGFTALFVLDDSIPISVLRSLVEDLEINAEPVR